MQSWRCPVYTETMDKATKPAAPDYIVAAAKEGFVWECSCGELFRTADAARTCRKCRYYAPERAGEQPTNTLEVYAF